MQAWRDALALPHAELAALITADDEAGRALRRTSPFAGLLNHAERRRLRALFVTVGGALA